MEFKRPADAFLLYDNKPADEWERAYPLGNGKLGLMVFGDPERETLSANEDTLWSGFPRHNEYRNDGRPSFLRAKKLTLEGKYDEAEKEATDHFTSYGVEAFLPMGDISLDFGRNKKITAYKRFLDLKNAVNVVSYKEDGKNVRSVSFVSAPAGGIFYRVEKEGGGLDLKIKLTSSLYHRVFIEDYMLCLEGECYENADQNRARTDRKELYSDAPEKRGMRFLWTLGILTDGRELHLGDRIEVYGASYVDIRSTARTSFNGFDKQPFTDGKEYKNAAKSALAEIKKIDYETALSEHIKDHRKYFDRVSLDVGSDGKAGVPTEKRIADYDGGASDKALPTLLFNFGRYLTIAGSRKGSEALNLQGIWNKEFLPPWQSNYTVNINLQMNYFPTLAISLPEMYEPLVRLVKELSESGKQTAKHLYDADGWVCHHNTDIWRHNQPVCGQAVWSFWCNGGGWLCHHLSEYYDYTLDKKYLKNTAFPVMEGAAKFYLCMLDRTPDGYLAVVPSTSPENNFIFNGKPCSLSETTEMTMSIVRELFGNVMKYAEVLGVDDDTVEKIKAVYGELRPPMIGKDGRLLEWYGEMQEREVTHRHVSHLYGLHPDMQFTPEKTPELAEACRKTLEKRGDAGTGWSLAWKCNFFARLHDGDHALSLLRQQLHPCREMGRIHMGGGGTFPNMFCAHPPFQIDGNFGITSGVCEMLVQSDDDELYLIPALPSEWADMKVSGLSAKCRRKVTMKTEGGKLVYCKISGSLPSRVTAAGEDITDKFKEVPGGFVFQK